MRTVAATLLFFFLHAAVFAQQFNAPVVATATGSTGAVVATMAAVANVKNWLCRFDVSGAGSATISPITVAGTLTGGLVYQGVTLLDISGPYGKEADDL